MEETVSMVICKTHSCRISTAGEGQRREGEGDGRGRDELGRVGGSEQVEMFRKGQQGRTPGSRVDMRIVSVDCLHCGC